MPMPTLYPYCRVLYKLDNSQGWKLAVMDGNEDLVKEKCETKGWYDYKISKAGDYIYHIEDNLNYEPLPDDIHRLTYLVYWQELNKWFDNGEIIPYPNKDPEITDDVEFKSSFDDTEYNFNDPEDFDKLEDIYISAQIDIKTKNQKTYSVVEISAMYGMFEDFIKKLHQNKFAVLYIDEFSYEKYLAWEVNDKVRFMIQDYCDNDERIEYVPIKFDVLMNKDIFYEKFERFYSQMKNQSEKLNQEFIDYVINKKL